MSKDTENEISLLDLAIVIKQNIKSLILAPMAACLVAIFGSYLIPSMFTATTSFLPMLQQYAAEAMHQRTVGGNLAAQYVALIKSRSVQDALVSRFDLMTRYETKLREDAVRALGKVARINAGKDGLITVEVDDRDPAFAAQLANAYVEELRKLLEHMALTDAQQRRMFYEKQLEQTKAQLSVVQSAWQARGADDVAALRVEAKMAAGAYAGLKAAVTAAHVKLQSMRSHFPVESPEFKLAQAELVTLQAQLSKAESSSIDADDERFVQYRDFKYQQSLAEMFAMQYELAKLDEALDGALIQVVDQAQVPERPSKPKRALIAVSATVATGFVVLVFVFIRQGWRNSLRDETTAQKLRQLF